MMESTASKLSSTTALPKPTIQVQSSDDDKLSTYSPFTTTQSIIELTTMLSASQEYDKLPTVESSTEKQNVTYASIELLHPNATTVTKRPTVTTAFASTAASVEKLTTATNLGMNLP